MNIKQTLIAMAIVAAFTANASVTVTNVVCKQQTPWNGKVDISYEVKSDDENAEVYIYATGFDQDANQSMAVRSVTGDGADGPVKPGKHSMVWNVTTDYPGFNSTAFSVKISALTGGSPYLVVDLSGGADAHSYPVSYLNQIPSGGWSEEYKTTKMVLRLLPPGTFTMGSPSDALGSQSDATLHQVTLTKPFYIGVFEVTQKQWELVMGTNPSSYKGDARPVDSVSYNAIRGSVNGAAWPANNQVDADTFMGRMRSKANMLFDLPTEAQWEYACRAGSGTDLNNGTSITNAYGDGNLAKLGRYYYNQSDNKGGYNSGHTTVGSYLPNVWGLYDMHGNVYEWCLDQYATYPKEPVTDPVGANSGSYRIVRGGGFYCGSGSYALYTYHCSSCYRKSISPSGTSVGYKDLGFRMVLVQ